MVSGKMHNTSVPFVHIYGTNRDDDAFLRPLFSTQLDLNTLGGDFNCWLKIHFKGSNQNCTP